MSFFKYRYKTTNRMAQKLPVSISIEEFNKLIDASKTLLLSHWKPRKEEYTTRGKTIQQYIICMALGFGAGMRISEILGLKKTYTYKYLNKKTNIEEVKTQVCNIEPLRPDKIETNYIRVVGAKGGKDRVIPLPTKLFKKLGITRNELINNLPIKVKRSAVQKFFTALALKVLNKNVSFHKLRHGFGTHTLQSGVDIHQVQMFMGHSRLDTTGLYLHANPKEALDKYEAIAW